MKLDLSISQRLSPPRHALVVDDDPLARRLAMLAARNCGVAEAAEADCADAALALLSQRSFDLIICDLAMPDQDGLDLLRRFSAAGHRGAIVIVSGHGEALRTAAERVPAEHGCRVLGTLGKPV